MIPLLGTDDHNMFTEIAVEFQRNVYFSHAESDLSLQRIFFYSILILSKSPGRRANGKRAIPFIQMGFRCHRGPPLRPGGGHFTMECQKLVTTVSFQTN